MSTHNVGTVKIQSPQYKQRRRRRKKINENLLVVRSQLHKNQLHIYRCGGKSDGQVFSSTIDLKKALATLLEDTSSTATSKIHFNTKYCLIIYFRVDQSKVQTFSKLVQSKIGGRFKFHPKCLQVQFTHLYFADDAVSSTIKLYIQPVLKEFQNLSPLSTNARNSYKSILQGH